jgi:hypothetical protein
MTKQQIKKRLDELCDIDELDKSDEEIQEELNLESKLEKMEKKEKEKIMIDDKVITLTSALEKAAERAEVALQEFEKVTAQREIEEQKEEIDEKKEESGSGKIVIISSLIFASVFAGFLILRGLKQPANT